MSSNVVTSIARTDIKEFLENERGPQSLKNKKSYTLSGIVCYDTWDISVESLFTKESKALNKELGLIGINSYKK